MPGISDLHILSHSDSDDIRERFKEQDVVSMVDSKARSSDAEGNRRIVSNFISSIRKEEPIVSRRELWSYYRAFILYFI